MPQSWTCDGCGWLNPAVPLCERCGQALHYQKDPPLDIPRRPGLMMMPEFWNFLLWTFIALAGSAFYLPPLSDLTGISAYWLLLHLLIFGGAALAALRTLVFARLFNLLELTSPVHARSGTVFEVSLELLPYETVAGLHAHVTLREFWFGPKGRLRSRRYSSMQLNRGSPLRGRRLHQFVFEAFAPVPDRRYLNLQNEVQLSVYRALGSLIPELGIATAHLRADGGWFVQLRLRRGPFVKVIERRIVLYAPGEKLLVG